MLNRVDPELLTNLKNYPVSDLNEETLGPFRKMRETQQRKMLSKLPVIEGVRKEERSIPGASGHPDVTVRIYRPDSNDGPLPALLWIHGGGYVLGGMDGDEYPSKLRVKNVGCVVVSVDYRLAPEHPYPAALMDCYAALKWMTKYAVELVIDPDRIAIGGASAGGGLAAALALLARDRGKSSIIYQMLVYPMIDDANVAPAGDGLSDTLIWSREKNLFGWTSYLGRTPGGNDVTPYEAAFRADDVSGLPPAIIVVGDLDLFVVENMAYAQRLMSAGIPTELHVYPGAYHGFNGFAPGASVSRKCNAALDAALKKALNQ